MRSALVDLPSQPIRNRMVVPVPKVAQNSGWTHYSSQPTLVPLTSTAVDGAFGPFSGYWRATVGSVGATGAILYILASGTTGFARLAVLPGRTYAALIYGRPSWATNTRVILEWYDSAGAWISASNGTASAHAANAIETRSVTGVAPAGAAVVKVIFQRFGGGEPVAGSTLDASGVMAVEGSTVPGYYADGDIPGWRWTGTAGASESVGYPYTLQSIAGPPLVSLTAPGTVSAPLPAFQGRTLYIVHDVLSTASDYVTIGRAGSVASGGISYGPGSAGELSLRMRFDTSGGTTNAVLSVPNSRTVGRHIVAGSINDGLTAGTMIADGGQTIVTSNPFTPAAGIGVNGTTQLSVGTSSDVGVALLMYGAEHNDVTRRRVLAWLARAYGATIPTGY